MAATVVFAVVVAVFVAAANVMVADFIVDDDAETVATVVSRFKGGSYSRQSRRCF